MVVDIWGLYARNRFHFYEILMKSLKAWDVSGTGQSNTQDLENARSSIPMLNRLEMLVSNVLSPWISTGNFWFRKLQLDGKPHFLWFLVTISQIQILDGTVSYLVWQCTIQVHQRNLSILWTLFHYHQKLCLCFLLCRLDDFTRKSFRLVIQGTSKNVRPSILNLCKKWFQFSDLFSCIYRR